MPPVAAAAADAFLILDFVAGNRRVPHRVFAALLASLPSVSPRTSPRIRRGLALRALDAALSDSADASTLLHRARAVLADPDLAPCFPEHLSVAAVNADDAAAVADLRRLVDVAWADLPPSVLEGAADRIVGAGALETWANADCAKRKMLRQLVGESMEREILGDLGQDSSTVREVNKPASAPSTSGGNESDPAQEYNDTDLARENDKADHAHEDTARDMKETAKGATVAQLSEELITRMSAKGKEHAQENDEGNFVEENCKAGHTHEHSARHQKKPWEGTPDAQIPEEVVIRATDNSRDHAQADDEPCGKADHRQEASARRGQETVEGTQDALHLEGLVTRVAAKGKYHDIPEVVDKGMPSYGTGLFDPDNSKNHPVTGSKHGLMERSTSAVTFEWDDDFEDLCTERPLPKRRSTYSYKPRKMWSEIEEKTLMEGVERYGKGYWKDIKVAYPDVFKDRSTVDMKDKFRNMEKQRH